MVNRESIRMWNTLVQAEFLKSLGERGEFTVREIEDVRASSCEDVSGRPGRCRAPTSDHRS